MFGLGVAAEKPEDFPMWKWEGEPEWYAIGNSGLALWADALQTLALSALSLIDVEEAISRALNAIGEVEGHALQLPLSPGKAGWTPKSNEGGVGRISVRLLWVKCLRSGRILWEEINSWKTERGGKVGGVDYDGIPLDVGLWTWAYLQPFRLSHKSGITVMVGWFISLDRHQRVLQEGLGDGCKTDIDDVSFVLMAWIIFTSTQRLHINIIIFLLYLNSQNSHGGSHTTDSSRGILFSSPLTWPIYDHPHTIMHS